MSYDEFGNDLHQNWNQDGNQQDNQQQSQQQESDSIYSYSYVDINQGDDEAKKKRHFFQRKPSHNNTGDGHRQGGWGRTLGKVVAIALIFGLVAGTAFQGSSYVSAKLFGTDQNSTTVATTSTTLSTAGSLDSTSTSAAATVSDVSDVVTNVMPAIVAVTNMTVTEYQSFFGQTNSRESETVGSGIIISQDNDYLYIATNNHVVSSSESLTITFSDDSVVSATVKGTDASMDLAVVAVALDDIDSATLSTIKVATVGDSNGLNVGSAAIVIGNALGYGQSVTTGVISAVNREVTLQDDTGSTMTNELIQTDAAVNPGNSGGALLNMNGEVVGIVSAKYSDTSVEGMGYAIPMSSAASIIEQIINNETVSEEDSSYFGIAGVDVSSSVAQQYSMPTGVYVAQVVSGSSADKAGIVKGDIITKFNGRSVTSMEEIQSMMQYIKAGTTVDVTVAKAANSYETTDIQVTLGSKK